LGVQPQEAFGANVRRARKRAGLSQEALGFASGVHRTEVSLIELGQRNPRLTTVVRLARGLGIDLCELLTGVA
jgi:transcriptional regulator with XRE-family HTH domain